VCIRSYVDIEKFGDLELADWRGFQCCYIFNEICIDTKREVKSGSKDFNCRSSLESDTNSSFKCC
jgi:hypothetical protein